MHDFASHSLPTGLGSDANQRVAADLMDDITATPAALPRVSSLLGRLTQWWSRTIPSRPYLSVIRRALRPLPDRWYLALGHFAYFRTWPNYRSPRTFNEHIQSYMLRSRNPLLKITADKLAMREYVAREVGSEYLVPLLGVWLDPHDVPLDALPRPCVLKASVGSGMIFMLRDRDPATTKKCRRQMERWLRRDYSKLHREWAYEKLPRRILAEPMLLDDVEDVPPDYKVYVINGKVQFIQVDRGRFKNHTRNLYDTNWLLLPVRLTIENHPLDARPAHLERMIDISERLSKSFEFLRTDFYLIAGKLYIGELTNYPGAGFERFMPHSFAEELGAMWKIPNI